MLESRGWWRPGSVKKARLMISTRRRLPAARRRGRATTQSTHRRWAAPPTPESCCPAAKTSCAGGPRGRHGRNAGSGWSSTDAHNRRLDNRAASSAHRTAVILSPPWGVSHVALRGCWAAWLTRYLKWCLRRSSCEASYADQRLSSSRCRFWVLVPAQNLTWETCLARENLA